ncbi:DUF4253 domain-containing protein [Thiorhodospira sibirica]|uniref:DUF4253 domain-containing protein n=1 Tax=Thiorhodospira sibirica TaxID=154347 RepID=UPI00022C117F|nr:DUF4253 domain-containing protein [Thiorhodospira sibirica]
MTTVDRYTLIRHAQTDGINYDLDTQAIIERLQAWEALCEFRVTGAQRDSLHITFDTLPEDLDAFVRELYDFCPDLVDQGTGCMDDLLRMIKETGYELDENEKKLIEEIDFEDENFGLEILKRDLERKKSLMLWWD